MIDIPAELIDYGKVSARGKYRPSKGVDYFDTVLDK